MSSHRFVVFPKDKAGFLKIAKVIIEHEDSYPFFAGRDKSATAIRAIVFDKEGISIPPALKKRVIHCADEFGERFYSGYDWVDRLDDESDTAYMERVAKVLYPTDL